MSEETSEGSKRAGYTYWKRNIDDAHVLPSCEPREIPHSSSEESLGNRTSSLASKWNSGTTYEEKDITERAKNVLISLISESRYMDQKYECEKGFSTGEVHAHIVRGKAKIGYEIESLEIKVVGKGIIEIEDLDSTDPAGFIVKADAIGDARNFVTQLMNDMSKRLLTE